MLGKDFLRCCEEKICCCSGEHVKANINQMVYFWDPKRVGSKHIILCGKHAWAFPYKCMVGPDWPVVFLVFILIIGISVPILYMQYEFINVWVFATGMLIFSTLLLAYTATACSDPGIYYTPDHNPPIIDIGARANPSVVVDESTDKTEAFSSSMNGYSDGNERDVETGTETGMGTVALEPLPSPPKSSGGGDPVFDCGVCKHSRPRSVGHCHYCGVCIDNIDHHCPWSGQCIAEKNIVPFRYFVCCVSLQCWFCLGTFIYAMSVIVRQNYD